MNSLQFYFEHSLAGFFWRRAKRKWFPTPIPTQCVINGVTLQLDCLPQSMQQILLAGSYEQSEMKILPELICSSDKVLEIGAAIGLLGLFCRKVLKVEKLVSVEPNPTTLTYLRKNYELNGIKPNIIEAALTKDLGPVRFFAQDMFWADSIIGELKHENSKEMIVEGLPFTSLVERVGFVFNALIIDIEGAEQYISIKSIPDHVCKILIEIHPELIGVRKAYGILEDLIRMGFQVRGQHLNSWSLIRNSV